MRIEDGGKRAPSWSRRKVAVGLGAAICLVAAVALPASGKVAQKDSSAKSAVTVVTVTAGKPSELAFKLSTKKISPGKVTFKVTNQGLLTHTFKICASAKGGSANACVGRVTPILKHGKSWLLTVILTKGTHEYICTIPGHAAGGMKGVLGVGVTATAPSTSSGASATGGSGTTSGSGSSTGSTTTTASAPPPAATAALIGDPVAGKTVFTSSANPPCASCHTMKAAGSTGTAGPNLDSLAPDQGTVVTAVTYGLPGGMPAFGQTGMLNSSQINNVAAYVYQSTHQ